MNMLQNFRLDQAGIEHISPVYEIYCGGVMGLYWKSRSEYGAGGTYWSDVPRLMIFQRNIPNVMISEGYADPSRAGRPVSGVVYVPAGHTLRSHFTLAHEFDHLDLHFSPGWLLDNLAPILGESIAKEVLGQMIERDCGPEVGALADLLVKELSDQSHDNRYFESLARAMVLAALTPARPRAQSPTGRLTAYQVKKLERAFADSGWRRMAVAEMADLVGLSESWFSHAFKSTIGVSPLQWQQGQRIRRAQTLLHDRELSVAEVSGLLGFSDQSHFTKVFRTVAGQTPISWRRSLRN